MCVGVDVYIKYGYIIRWLFFLLIVYRFECYGETYIIVIWCQFTDASDIMLFVTVFFCLGDSFYYFYFYLFYSYFAYNFM